jgi:hypothetical protein
MDRDDFNILAAATSIQLFVLDAKVREMHLVVEVRQVVFPCPLFDLTLIAIGTSAVVVMIAIVLVEPTLVLTLEFVVEDDSLDACAAFLEARRFTFVGAIDLDVVFQFARFLETGVELLWAALTMCSTMVMQTVAALRLEQVATLFGQHDHWVSMAVQPFNFD